MFLGIALATTACSAGDNAVDPRDLALRDLLGLSPDLAAGWTPAQRAAGRDVLIGGFRTAAPPLAQLAFAEPAAAADADRALGDDDVARSLATGDARRANAELDPLGVVVVTAASGELVIAARAAPITAAMLEPGAAPPGPAPVAGAPIELQLASAWDREPRWSHLPDRGLDVLSALARDAAHPGGPVIVVPAPRLAVIAAYIPPRAAGASPHLAVNPVLLAALEPADDEATGASPTATAAATAAALGRWTVSPAPSADSPHTTTTRSAVTAGNPYSFFGSFEECAQAQRARCEACLPGATCTSVTNDPSGNDECTTLAADSGRGYFLLCINLSLAISAVNDCARDAAPTCTRDPDAADQLATLANNAGILEDPACAGALDGCLAKIYGAPNQPFPGVDGGVEPVEPPRSTSAACANSCETQNTSCSGPTVDCTGPSCNNSLSCNSACSSSNNQSGCGGGGGNCGSCSSNTGGGGGGGGCGGGSSSSGGSCGGGGGSGGGGSCGGGSGSSSSGGSCGGGSGSSSSGGSCGGGSGSSSGGSCGGGSGSGGSCGGGSGGGGSCGGSSSGSSSSCGGGGSSGGKCDAAGADPGPAVALVMSVMWGFLPVPFAAFTRRRARRRKPARTDAADDDPTTATAELHAATDEDAS